MDNTQDTKSTNTDKPLLLVDVDGVLNRFGLGGHPLPEEVKLVKAGGYSLHISDINTKRLQRLSEHFKMVWATIWEGDANKYIAPLHDLPNWPYIIFQHCYYDGVSTWKLNDVQKYVGERPMAWIDDDIQKDAYAWADERKEEIPTLLLRTDPFDGLTEEIVEQLLKFAIEVEGKS